jgi:3-oxoacyl-[acyl-carrier-protein] synthase II
MQHEIIVSSIGYNSVRGTGADTYWQQSPGDTQEMPVIHDIDPQKYLNSKGQKFLNKSSLIYCNIAFQCIHDRGLQHMITTCPDRIGLYDSSELSNVEACFMFDLIAKNEGPDYVSPMNAPNTIANAAASEMAIQAGIKGPNVSVCCGAAGSLQALDIACLHLKQGVTDYAIVGSTEVINKYQASIRKGENRDTSFYSSELGAALLIEKGTAAALADGSKRLAVIKQFASGTQMAGESKEELLWRLLQKITENTYHIARIDLLIVSGGAHNMVETDLDELLKIKNFKAPLVYLEKQFGSGDNAGGILGVTYAIGIFTGKILNIPANTGSISTTENKIQHVIVASIDSSGAASVVLVSNSLSNSI